MFDAISATAAALRDAPTVRAVVLTGAGKSFCSGLDLASLMSVADGLNGITAELRGPVPNRFQRAAHDWLTLPMPVIAAIHGNCFGGGLQIALAADIRLVAPDARLSVMEIRWGLVPDMSITRTCPASSGSMSPRSSPTRRVCSTATRRSGLVSRRGRQTIPLAAAATLAAEIAGRSPDAVRAVKRLFDAIVDGDRTDDPGA